MIKLNKINKSFGEGLSEVHVLKNLSLDVNTGEFVAVMGKSGWGKDDAFKYSWDSGKCRFR